MARRLIALRRIYISKTMLLDYLKDIFKNLLSIYKAECEQLVIVFVEYLK